MSGSDVFCVYLGGGGECVNLFLVFDGLVVDGKGDDDVLFEFWIFDVVDAFAAVYVVGKVGENQKSTSTFTGPIITGPVTSTFSEFDVPLILATETA